MWIEDIVNYIRGLNISGVGNNVFAYTMKENDTGVVITSTNTGIPSSNEFPNYYKGPMQLIVRSNNPRDSNEQAIQIANALDSLQRRSAGGATEMQMGSVLFKYIYSRHLPVIYPRSDGAFYEASINFDVCFVAIS